MIFRYASAADIPLIEQLAHEIWQLTYSEIISADQINFMLKKMYSQQALLEQLGNGVFFIMVGEFANPVGFASYSNAGKGVYKIHKLYLQPCCQGKGTGRALIEFITQEVLKKAGSTLELNVNRNNPAFNFYTKVGFKVTDEVDTPYYGYVLNDFIMRKELN